MPLYDLVQRGKAKNDAPFYFSWYAGDFTTDPEFAATSTDTERAVKLFADTVKTYRASRDTFAHNTFSAALLSMESRQC